MSATALSQFMAFVEATGPATHLAESIPTIQTERSERHWLARDPLPSEAPCAYCGKVRPRAGVKCAECGARP